MDNANDLFKLAAAFVNHTSRHIFLTGRAGTGKTTFLKYVREHTGKQVAVVAPTGVAAINAGGVTAHSLFGLPFGVFVPSTVRGFSHHSNVQISDRHSIFKNMRMSGEKRKLLQELELLIIDEVSMLRCDMLDAIDTMLRSVRRRAAVPFGGVQVLYIGDLFQLPPVAKNEEWEILKEYYESPFFFHSHAVQEAQPVIIELKKIYRQAEGQFIHLLNHIRNNTADYEDLELLHSRYKPNYQPPPDQSYILLTSHNAKADEVNRRELARLTANPYYFEADVEGEFFESAYPAEKTLQLKVGAQIMFIKNDKGEPRRYYNGRIAHILSISEDVISVIFPDTKESIVLEKETWRNIRYKYNEQQQNVEEEELGTFKQYPIRLAWAITIHKSQGLTFERAIVDAGSSFAPGQVYVALSRLTTLEGLVLHSQIPPRAIATDHRVLSFASSELPFHEQQQLLMEAQTEYLHTKLMQSFGWAKLISAWAEFDAGYTTRGIPLKEKAIDWSKTMFKSLHHFEDVAIKFRSELEALLSTTTSDYKALNARVAKAAQWFLDGLQRSLLDPLAAHYKEFEVKPRTKRYLVELSALGARVQRKEHELKAAAAITSGLAEGVDIDLVMEKEGMLPPLKPIFKDPPKSTAEVKGGNSALASLTMFQEGKSIPEIAETRSLAPSTIESHLAAFVRTGELSIDQLVSKEKHKEIMHAIKLAGKRETAPIKQLLPPEYTYSDIRAVLNHLAYMNERG